MDKVRVRQIAPHERDKLHAMKRRLKNAVNRCHARIILLSSGRVCNREIASRVGVSPQWVREIIHRFNWGGMDAIEWYPYFQVSRRSRRYTADVQEEIAAVALSPPSRLIGMAQWSLSKLREYLQQQKIVRTISLEWLRILLRRCHVRWRRTKTWKESNDPQFQAKFRRLRRLYKRCPAGGRRICIDEFGPLNLQPRHGQCWKGPGKGVERLRATYHRRGGVEHFFGAYDLEDDRLFGLFSTAKTAVEFLTFLQWLRRKYPRRITLHIVMDNYSPHLKKEIAIWAALHRIKFYLTPTNASWLNRIECQFTALKKFALANTDFQTHEEQEDAINRYLTWRNRQRNISLENWKAYKKGQRHAA